MKKTVEYFAYGSNLSTDQMEQREIPVVSMERAELPGWTLSFPVNSRSWGGGVADIVPSEKERVEGVVYTIEIEGLNNLDHYEGRKLDDGMETGMYRRQYLPVKLDDGWKTVLTYVVNLAVEYKKDMHIKPSKEYLGTIIAGVTEHGLSEDYLQMLKNIDTKN